MPTVSIQEGMRIALEHQRAGRSQEAEAIYRQVLGQHPDHPDALHNLGVIEYHRGRLDVAAELMRRAIAANASVPEHHFHLGNALAGLGRTDEAIDCHKRAIAMKPDLAAAHNNLGTLLEGRGQLDEAIECYRKAIGLSPQYAVGHYNLANALQARGRLDEAIEHFRTAALLRGDLALAHNNLGAALHARGRMEEAIQCYRRAMSVDPQLAMAHNNLGNCLREQGRVQEAIECYRRAVALKPGFADAHSNLLSTLHCHGGYDAGAIHKEHVRWAEQHAEPLTGLIRPHENHRDPGRRLRVGYVSADFRQHSVAFFIEPVIEAHDRRGFEVICYSNVAWPDAVTMRMRKLADQWRDIARRCDEDVAEQIRRDGVDILVDLAGHTDGNRLLVFARKPAPVQVTYLGYPDTTGLRTMDYRLTDAYADPPGETEPYHSEELVRLARCFLCYRPATESPEVGELPALAAGTVTFGSFNSFAKVTEEVMGAWSRILLAVPESRLVLKAKGLGQAEARERAGEVFERHGIAPQRVEMTGQSESFVEHLRAYQCVDIALDTFPYNGTTTTCEALWMGVPVITLAGRSHVWRVGMSLLSNAGLPELIAATLDDYVAAAARLAGDVDGLRQMRRGLRQRLGASALTDAAGFTRRLEEAYRGIWANWCAGRQ